MDHWRPDSTHKCEGIFELDRHTNQWKHLTLRSSLNPNNTIVGPFKCRIWRQLLDSDGSLAASDPSVAPITVSVTSPFNSQLVSLLCCAVPCFRTEFSSFKLRSYGSLTSRAASNTWNLLPHFITSTAVPRSSLGFSLWNQKRRNSSRKDSERLLEWLAHRRRQLTPRTLEC